MTDIPLFPLGQTSLPSERAGAVKPPLSLADRSAEVSLALSGAKFAGDIFNDLVETRAASEEAAFHGAVNTALQEWDTFVASNPGAGYDQLQKQRDLMMSNITKAGQQATTRQGKRNNANWLTANRNLIHAKSETSMEAIRSKQEIAAYRFRQEKNITNFDDTEYISDQENMIASGLLNRDIALAQREVDLSVMAEAQKKVALGNAVGVGFAAWQDTVTSDDPDGNLNVAFEALDALPIPEGERQEVESELKTRVNNRRAEAKLQQEQAADTATDDVNEKLNKGEFDGINAFINSRKGITETQKNGLITHATAFTKAVNDAKEDTVTTDETNISIDRIIDDVRNGRKTYEEGIAAYSDVASGVKASEGSSNLDDIRKAADFSTNEATTKQVVKNGQAVTGRMRSVAISMVNADPKLDDAERLPRIAAIEERFFGYQTQLDEWAVANKDDPNFNEKYQKQVNGLFRPEIEEITLNAFQRFLRVKEESPFRGLAKIAGTTEEAALARKRFKALGDHPVFQTMTKKEKDDAKKLFRAGSTLAEVIALLEGE